MANYRYPLDLLGTNPSNRVSQTRTLNMTSKMGDKFFIPADAPFFAENLILYKVGTATPLTRGIDYELIFNYPDIFQRTQKEVYGGVKFKDRNISGQVRIEMQILGGPFLQPVQNTLETIARNKTNVNTATWGELAGVPAGFPVLNHPMVSDDITGFGEVNTTLREISSILLANIGDGEGGNGSGAMAALAAHIQNPTNAHNKAAVGLGNVPNFALSTYEEADLGVNNRLTTPALVKYLISKYSGLSTITTIQQQIVVLNRDVQILQQDLQTNTISISNINTRVTQLSNQFESVRQEFSNILVYISDLGLSIENIQLLIQDTKNQVEDALRRVSEMETIVNRISLQNDNINEELQQLRTSVSGLSTRLSAMEEVSFQISLSIAQLNTTVLYPIRRIINAGSFHFSIRPGETRRFTLIGPGGAGGILIPIGEDGLAAPRGDRGGDTYLVLNTDLTNGNNTNGDVILRAESGRGGQSSKQSLAGIEFFGKGGPGGQTSISNLFTNVTNSIGAGGVDGLGTPGTSHPGATGTTFQGKIYASGGASAAVAGSAGAGAMVIASLTNTYNFDLQFTAVVGEPPRNPIGNAFTPAAPGLFVIDVS